MGLSINGKSFFKEGIEMALATLQFYQNEYPYPNYSDSLSTYGSSMECTPVGIGLKSGTLRVSGTMNDFMSSNYLALTWEGRKIYGWIDDVKFRTADSFDVSYMVDPWRTYKDHIFLGDQIVMRHTDPTNLFDPLLGSSQSYPNVTSYNMSIGNPNTRVFVIQVRPDSGEVASNSPVQPTPYQFFAVEYDINNWQSTQPIVDLFTALRNMGETTNIVTTYSIPGMDMSSLSTGPMTVSDGNTDTTVNGFYFLDPGQVASSLLYQEVTLPFSTMFNVSEITRVSHSIQIVIPDGGIMDVPDGVLHTDPLKLRRDVDLFSGASNYMLVDSSGTPFAQSVRGSAVSSIPILSDPYDTYISQNQNALTTSMIGDVAMMAGSAAMMFTPAGRALGAAGSLFGAEAGAEGLSGFMDTIGQTKDAKAQTPSNPPAMLGTALANTFNNQFWVMVTKQDVDNGDIVHSSAGYPLNKMTSLTFPPPGGYVQTAGCAVTSDGTVPRWAVNEINRMFNAGVAVF
jgi:hypothetical protein